MMNRRAAEACILLRELAANFNKKSADFLYLISVSHMYVKKKNKAL